MKVNFYNDIQAGFSLIKSHFKDDKSDYLNNVKAIEFIEPEDKTDKSAIIRYERRVAAYRCCLYKAEFKSSKNMKIKFSGNADLNKLGLELERLGEIKRRAKCELYEINRFFKSDWFKTLCEAIGADPNYVAERCKEGLA
jgi:hypothetical protein